MRKAALAGCWVVGVCLAIASDARAASEPTPTPREGAAYAVALFGALLRPYDAPDDPYAPGHRGLDVAAPSGEPVRAAAAGVVAFAGNVAGNLTVSVDHPDGVRTTYSYLGTIGVVTGQTVAGGQALGTVGAGHPGSGAPPHVHLSVRRGGEYVDPLTLLVGVDLSSLLSVVG